MNVLIIGKDSYIGNHIDEWLRAKGWNVNQLDVLTDEWKSYDYSKYDAVVHVAGIVHKPNCKDWSLYKSVNADMPISIASMAKKQGRTKSYVYFSTMAVYGLEKRLRPTLIYKNTPLFPISMYGKSKLMAEEGLFKLQDESFNIICVRPPSVYGKGCKGNYISGFTKFVKSLPFFPVAFLHVKQSVLYIDNLCEFIYLVLCNNSQGVYCPQDPCSVNAVNILDAIADGIKVKRHHSRLLGIGIHLLGFLPIVKKAYGGIEYSTELSDLFDGKYQMIPFREGIRRTLA